MADNAQTQALISATGQLIPAATPTALSAAVAQVIGATTMSPLPVQAPKPLAVGYQPAPAPPKSKLPMILGVSGGAIGLGLLAWFMLRRGKKRR